VERFCRASKGLTSIRYALPPHPFPSQKTDQTEMKKVTPAIECFGSHRLIYGSQPVPAFSSQTLLEPEKWTELIWPVVAEVCCAGERDEAQAEVDAVFGANMQRILGQGRGDV
jgi:hypothetical protein